MHERIEHIYATIGPWPRHCHHQLSASPLARVWWGTRHRAHARTTEPKRFLGSGGGAGWHSLPTHASRGSISFFFKSVPMSTQTIRNSRLNQLLSCCTVTSRPCTAMDEAQVTHWRFLFCSLARQPLHQNARFETHPKRKCFDFVCYVFVLCWFGVICVVLHWRNAMLRPQSQRATATTTASPSHNHSPGHSHIHTRGTCVAVVV